MPESYVSGAGSRLRKYAKHGLRGAALVGALETIVPGGKPIKIGSVETPGGITKEKTKAATQYGAEGAAYALAFKGLGKAIKTAGKKLPQAIRSARLSSLATRAGGGLLRGGLLGLIGYETGSWAAGNVKHAAQEYAKLTKIKAEQEKKRKRSEARYGTIEKAAVTRRIHEHRRRAEKGLLQ